MASVWESTSARFADTPHTQLRTSSRVLAPPITLNGPPCACSVLASTFALLANLVLLFWRKDLLLHGEPVSPWNREFVLYLVVSAACVGGGFFFMQGDLLVAKKFFLRRGQLTPTTAPNGSRRALPITVAPLLTVLFTSRSGARTGHIVGGQLKLLGLYLLA